MDQIDFNIRLRWRGFYDTPLFQIFYHHYSQFQDNYSRAFESEQGFFRRDKVIDDGIANNMLSWPHSGFHLFASDPFTDKVRIKTCLQYAFRPAVALERLCYDSANEKASFSQKKPKIVFTNKNKMLSLHPPLE